MLDHLSRVVSGSSRGVHGPAYFEALAALLKNFRQSWIAHTAAPCSHRGMAADAATAAAGSPPQHGEQQQQQQQQQSSSTAQQLLQQLQQLHSQVVAATLQHQPSPTPCGWPRPGSSRMPPPLLLQRQHTSLAHTHPLTAPSAAATANSLLRLLHSSPPAAAAAADAAEHPTAAAPAAHADEEGASTAAVITMQRSHAHGQTAAFADLAAQLSGAGLPPAVVKAILSQAPSWPSLSKDPQGLLHRVDKLSALLASRQDALAMLLTHPQVLTRPPAALKQQLVNLALWLHIPLAHKPPTTAAAAAPSSHPTAAAAAEPDLQACQDLMALVVARPGVLFLPENAVKHQLADIQDLLKLPALPKGLGLPAAAAATEDPLRHPRTPPTTAAAAAEEEQVLQALANRTGSREDAQAVLSVIDSLGLVVQHKQHTEPQQHLQERRRQYAAALDAWRQQQQQQQQQQLPLAADSSGAAAAAAESWARRLVCQEPDWLFVDTAAALPRRLAALQRLLVPAAASSSGSSSSSTRQATKGLQQGAAMQLQALLLRAPQLLTVNSRQLSARVKMWRGVLLDHFRGAKTAQDAAAAAARIAAGAVDILESSSGSSSSAAVLEWDALMEEVLLLLLSRQPRLLLQPAKVIEQRAAEVQQRLPHQPLDVLLQLLAAPQLHWSQLDYLQHTGQLPQSEPSASHSYDLQGAQAVLASQQHFSRQNPQFPAWQAAAAAVQAASTGERKSWGWRQEFDRQLTGPACHGWLQEMEGRWQRLLLLAAGKPWVKYVGSSSSSRAKRSRSTADLTHALSLQDVASVADGAFPYRPAEKLGPLLFDASQQQLQQLLTQPKSELTASIIQAAQVWQALSAAVSAVAAGGDGGGGFDGWQQQLAQVHWLLPSALLSAAQLLPPESEAVRQYVSADSSSSSRRRRSMSSSSSSSSDSSSDGGSSRSWVSEVMAARVSEAAAAAAAARHGFWQQLQQPGVLAGLLDRLTFLNNLGGPEAAAAVLCSEAAPSLPQSYQHWLQQQQQQQQDQQQWFQSTSPGQPVNPHQLWSVLVASEQSFRQQFPAFPAWQRIARLVVDKPAWREELAGMQGAELLAWLPQANSRWERLAFLSAPSSSHHHHHQQQQQGFGEEAGSATVGVQPGPSLTEGGGGMWQAISMADAVGASDLGFLEMFPEAGLLSWQQAAAATAAVHDGRTHADSSSSSSSSSAADTPQESVPVPAAAGGAAAAAAQPSGQQAGTGAVAGGGGGGGGGKAKRNVPDAATAGKRAQVLLEYAARFPPWQAEVQGAWGPQEWAEATRLLRPVKLPRLEYFLQVQADLVDSSSSSSSSSSAGSLLQQRQQRAASLLWLLRESRDWCRDLPGGRPLFEAWRVVGEAVGESGVPCWGAEWRGLRGEAARGLLGGVLGLTAVWQEGVREAAMQQRLGELVRPVAEPLAAGTAATAADDVDVDDGEGEAVQLEECSGAVAAGSGLQGPEEQADSAAGLSSSSSSSSGSDSDGADDDGLLADAAAAAAPAAAATAPAVPSGFEFTREAHRLQYPGLLELGVTGAEGLTAAAAGSGGSGGSEGAAAAASAAAAAAAARAQKQGLPPGIAFAAARLAFFQNAALQGGRSTAAAAAAASSSSSTTPQGLDLSLQQLLSLPQQELVQRFPGLDPGFAAAQVQGFAAAEQQVLRQLYPWLREQAVGPALAGLSAECRSLLARQPRLLLHLQQFASTWPTWQRQLAAADAPVLEELLQQMAVPARVQRLQLAVRAGFQKYNSLRRVLCMSDAAWAARYPIAQQVAELQEAAEGVRTWEQQLSRQPSGPDLVLTIGSLHRARHRLVWLQQQGLEGAHRSALKVLSMTGRTFRRRYPDYPGDDACEADSSSDGSSDG